MVDYTRVPVAYMAEGVQRYIEHGIPPGGFLMALFSNDLKRTHLKADAENRRAIQKWVEFMLIEMPAQSQGSPEKVREWIRSFEIDNSNNPA
jgi:hypothetical protein